MGVRGGDVEGGGGGIGEVGVVSEMSLELGVRRGNGGVLGGNGSLSKSLLAGAAEGTVGERGAGD